MAIEMHKVRAAILAALCLPYKRTNYGKLPGNLSSAPFNTSYPFCIDVPGQTLKGRTLHVKLLSQMEAKAFSATKARRPQRILAWCEECGQWQFAGKIVQHQKACGKKEERN